MISLGVSRVLSFEGGDAVQKLEAGGRVIGAKRGEESDDPVK